MKEIQVAAGVVVNPFDEILITKRHESADQGGLWEFPGGKIENDEDPFNALARELKEEVGIVVTEAEPLVQVYHEYEAYAVTLSVFWVEDYDGTPEPCENQPMLWVAVEDLCRHDFPEANLNILEKIYDVCT
jgi:8-oxo-dGTP diphosphatase